MKLAFICGSGYGRSDSLIITRKLRLLADDNESEVFVFIRGSEGNDKYREIAKNGAQKFLYAIQVLIHLSKCAVYG